jgi:6-phosphogluconolactonase (cycloisomerase 2 family)
MKLNKSSQLLLVSAASLLVAAVVTACGTLTVDFVYVATAKAAGSYNYGEIDVFEINSESGFMRQIPTSPFPSGGRDPVAEAVSVDEKNLYVVNQDDNTIVQFAIGNDGKLYAQNTTNTPGVYPNRVAVSGSYLYVLDTYQPLATCSTAAPCAGSVAVYPIGTSGALGTAITNASAGTSYWPLTLSGSNSSDVVAPTGITVVSSSSATYVYVTAYDSTANTGYVFGYSASSGVLTPLNGSPYSAGTHPSAAAGDSTNSYLYVTDYSKNEVLGYSISSGALTPLSGSPFASGSQPSAIAANPLAGYAYVTNETDSTITAYSISSSGALTNLGSFATGLQPVAVGIDPSHNHFLYTVNFLGNNVSGFMLANDGTLINSQNTPYSANSQPTSVAAVTHGRSSTSSSSAK